jgi:hypothetical protein
VHALPHPRLVGVLFLLACGILLGQAKRAEALTPPPEGWGVAYEQAAIEYWGEEATHCATTSVTFGSPLPQLHRLDQAEGLVLARATVAADPGTDCQMWIAPLEGRGIYFRCILFAHEYGHWIGHPDDPTDPRRSVRAELLGSYTQDAPCRDLVASVSGA